jgi:hypothetical protein
MFTPCCRRHAAYAAKPPDAAAEADGETEALPPEDPQAAEKSSAVADASSTPPWRIRMEPDAVPSSWVLPPTHLKGSTTPASSPPVDRGKCG